MSTLAVLRCGVEGAATDYTLTSAKTALAGMRRACRVAERGAPVHAAEERADGRPVRHLRSSRSMSYSYSIH